jgi:type 1 fimbriae regulatory protein FimB
MTRLASEACDLQWPDIDFNEGKLFVRRAKGSKSNEHYLEGDELRALRKLQRDQEPGSRSRRHRAAH